MKQATVAAGAVTILLLRICNAGTTTGRLAPPKTTTGRSLSQVETAAAVVALAEAAIEAGKGISDIVGNDARVKAGRTCVGRQLQHEQ